MRALIVLTALLLAGCSSLPKLHLPWRAATPAPGAVRELQVMVPADAQMPIVLQYWHRNALLVDMQGVASSGTFILQPRADAPWPIRLEFRVSPGRIQVLELVGAQRQVYAVSSGSAPVVISVDPALHPPGTATIAVNWGPTVK